VVSYGKIFTRRRGLVGLLVALGLALLAPLTASANGGSVVYQGDTGQFNIVVLMNPTPAIPTAPLHFDVILTKRNSPEPVNSATVIIDPSMPGMEMPGVVPQRLSKSQTRTNQYEVDLDVSMEGLWRFQFQIIDPALGSASFTVDQKVEKVNAPWAVIVGIIVGLPVLAGLSWFFLFRKGDEDDEDEDEDENYQSGGQDKPTRAGVGG
jgi:YtkA-like